MRILILTALLAAIGFGLAASARADCQTTCYRNDYGRGSGTGSSGGGQQTCNTHCW